MDAYRKGLENCGMWKSMGDAYIKSFKLVTCGKVCRAGYHNLLMLARRWGAGCLYNHLHVWLYNHLHVFIQPLAGILYKLLVFMYIVIYVHIAHKLETNARRW